MINTRQLYLPNTISDYILQLTKGKSSIAKLTESKPIAFNGMQEVTFSLDKEVDVVAENAAKSKGGITLKPVTIIPVKIEYGARVSDEFLFASEEGQASILQTFAEGFANKLARGFDILAMHGINPRTGSETSIVGNNCFDKLVTQKVIFDSNKANENIEAAVAMVQATEGEVSGIAMSPEFRSALAQTKRTDGSQLFPELAWGSAPEYINGVRTEVNSTVNAGDTDRAIVGDFENSFRWGIAKEMPIEVIRYGNPDNDTEMGDLKGHNQVYLRGEAYIGWGILNPNAFARITKE